MLLNIIRNGGTQYETNVLTMLTHKLANFSISALCVVLFICANTNSCCLIHQPQTPEGLERFGKIG